MNRGVADGFRPGRLEPEHHINRRRRATEFPMPPLFIVSLISLLLNVFVPTTTLRLPHVVEAVAVAVLDR